MKFFRLCSLFIVFSLSACGAPIQVAPDFNLSTLSNTSVVLSEVNREHPVLLVFWATWCPSCVAEIPAINRIQEKGSLRGLRVYAIDIEEPKEKIQAFLQNHEIKYTVLMDPDGSVSEKYKVSQLPTMILLAKGGKILYYGFRPPENYLEWLDKL